MRESIIGGIFMPGSYRHISEYEKEILRLKKEGKTLKEIGERLGFTREQIHNFITRYNEKQRKIAAGIVIKKKGRPSKDYQISEMCKFFEVSRSGYYDYVKRMELPDRDLPLAEQIQACQREVKQTYGYRRVQIWLERQGIQLKTKLTPMEVRCRFVAS